MILYRVLSDKEIKRYIGIYNINLKNDFYTGSNGCNTFKYKRGVEYMHFFRYAEHAKALIYKFGVIIAKFEIPDELIDQSGFGFYNDIDYPIPECIINENDFDVKYIKEFKFEPTVGWTTPRLPITEYKGKYIGSYSELYQELIQDIKNIYNKEKPSCLFIKYAANKLEGKDLDKLLLNYIDVVNEKRQKSKSKSFLNIFKRK